ncbi:maleylpyruvate isomerase family mycothiol-dependent enzyme [Nonomuraea sp. NPDC049152]|uniref:maleylpyruvate isomerase family mycothiol-dependent enzyme n=1 Tax=Nonomuraea sp. NPDC049152 TaxID=3154350 RepID=UPI0033F897D7
MGTPGVGRLAEGLREQTAAFADAAAGAHPAVRVPTCPAWLLRDLVAHVGHAHRWAAGIVRTGEPAPAPDPLQAEVGDPATWPEWLRDGARELIRAVEDVGAETQVWTLVGPLPARFWLRRILHETSVHHADAALTAGTAFSVAPDLAADAIDESLEILSSPWAASKPTLAELRGAGETLLFRPAERMAGWLITRTPAGVRSERGTAGADVVVDGGVADLLRVLTRRLPPASPEVTVTGDRALLRHWLDRTAFE